MSPELDLQTLASMPRPVVPPTSERLRTALGAIAKLMRDPGRLDQVLVFAQAVNAHSVARAAERFAATEEGRRLFVECPRIDRAHVDFDALRRLPDGTLGREYTRFLDDNGIGPEPFEALPDVADKRAAWIMLRMRQTHDLWHVLTGYTTDVRGEVLLQAFTYAQTGAPSAVLIAALGSLRWLKLRKKHLRELRHAYRRGKATQFLPTFRWEDHWATPVSELRERLTCPG
jgi:ubiquinone biosynthesis protein COQ4